MSNTSKLLSLGVLLAVFGCIYLIGFGYGELTKHNVEITVAEKYIDHGKEKSYYIVVGTDGNIIELDRTWYNWTDNIDRLYHEASPNKTMKLECFGWSNLGFHWYSTCYKIVP